MKFVRKSNYFVNFRFFNENLGFLKKDNYLSLTMFIKTEQTVYIKTGYNFEHDFLGKTRRRSYYFVNFRFLLRTKGY